MILDQYRKERNNHYVTANGVAVCGYEEEAKRIPNVRFIIRWNLYRD